jgi:hypothetical protein
MSGYLMIPIDIFDEKRLDIKRIDELFVVIIHIMKNGKSRLEVVILDNSDCLLDN